MKRSSYYHSCLRSKQSIMTLIFMITCYVTLGQEVYVKGQVSTINGESLPGVSILIRGTSTGAVTDLEGKYACYAPGKESDLIFSHIGFVTQVIQVGSQEIIDVVMEIDVRTLKELVVTGYATQNKRNFSGSISTVSPDEITSLPTTSVPEQLQGRIPGVLILNDPSPGNQNTKLRIRGFTTLNNNEPLYIVDGNPIRDLTSAVNPNDIASIQVLKDASAASIYGSRASSGVIVIVTKNGSGNSSNNISFDAYTGVQLPPNTLPELLNPQELSEVIKISKINQGYPLEHDQYAMSDGSWGLPDFLIPHHHSENLDGVLDFTDYDLNNPSLRYTKANKNGTDWMDEIFKPAILQNYNLSAGRGSENGSYFISAGYFNQEGIVNHSQYDKFYFRINSNLKFKDRIWIGENLGFNFQKYVGGSYNEALYSSLTIPQILPVYDIGGNYAGTGVGGMGTATNPVAWLDREKDNFNTIYSLFGSFFLEAELAKGLTIKTNFSPALSFQPDTKRFNQMYPENTLSDVSAANENNLTQQSQYSIDWTCYNTLVYQTTLSKIHNLHILLGSEAINHNFSIITASRSVFSNTFLNYQILDAGESRQANSGYREDWSLFSLFSKIDYDYAGKYILSLTARRDGSSRFGEKNRYGIFPAASIAWRVSDEPFMQGIPVDDLKIRASWGQMGNQEIGNYRINNTYSKDIFNAGYSITGAQDKAEIGIRKKTIGNHSTKWETTETYDLGLDFTILNYSLEGSIDWYIKKTSGMLLEVPPSTLLGIADYRPYRNIGEMRNTGIDVYLKYTCESTRDLRWSAGVNFSHYKNKVTKLYEGIQAYYMGWVAQFGGVSTSSITREGIPIGSFYGFKILGILQSEEEVASHAFQGYDSLHLAEGVGRWKIADTDSNNVINDYDRTIIGSPHPDFILGVPISFHYKGFDLDLFFYGSFGNDIFNSSKFTTDFFFANPWNSTLDSQKGKRILKSWGLPGVPDNEAILPKLVQNIPRNEVMPSTYYIEDGSFVRLKQITLGYTFNQILNGEIKNLRIYVQASNLFTITKYSGMDPMINSGGDQEFALDRFQYPASPSYLLGLNITL